VVLVDYSVVAEATPRLQAMAEVVLFVLFGQAMFDSFHQQERLMSNTLSTAKIEISKQLLLTN
jgi:hypothetical protein